ncbi:MAG: adenylate/guanylate cyclase domain-containing protein [Deltaproteobacteria bacterium]|nr:adenylate/guanylate cyclase domain-containing protein [Deltaproteobacteria bacterium]
MSEQAASRRPTRYRVARLALGLVTFVPTLLALLEQGPTLADRPVYDLLIRDVLPRATVDDEVVFVDIDDGSLGDLDQRWPIPRLMWARLVRQIAQFQPSAIALDAFFPERSSKGEVELALSVADRLRDDGLDLTPEGKTLADDLDLQAGLRDADRQLAKAIADAGNVVLGIADGGTTAGALAAAELPELPPIPGVPDHVTPTLSYQTPRGNIPELTMSARTQAGLHVPYSQDGIIRRYGYVARAGRRNVASLALAAAQVAHPDKAKVLGSRALSVDGGLPLLRWVPTEKIRRVRLSDILDAQPGDEALARALKGRIVFVGVSAVGAADRRQTPLRSDLPGTYVHINATFNLLHTEFTGSEGRLEHGLTIFAAVLALLLYIAWARVGSSSVVVFSAVGLALVWGGVAAVGLYQGWLVPSVPVLLGILVPMGGELVLRANSAEAARQQIRSAFQQYLSPAVVEELVADPDKLRLGGRRREITAFFSDVAGFTSISEALDPADLTALLNEYLGAMTDVILEEGGTVDKYIGDAIVAMFGAPLDQPDHAERAVRAALRCRQRLAELRPQWVARGWPEVGARIGVNSGVAVVGNMGSAQRFDYTMLGDTVNLAARLEGANKAYGIELMIGEKTAALVRDSFVLRELDKIRVKGKQQGVAVFEPVAQAGAADPETARRISEFAIGLTAWRGREWEVARSRFQSAANLGDEPAKVFLARLETIVQDPPGPDWDGVYEMKTK